MRYRIIALNKTSKKKIWRVLQSRMNCCEGAKLESVRRVSLLTCYRWNTVDSAMPVPSVVVLQRYVKIDCDDIL
eukprot:764289-Hanusia_phi.AAC.4